MKYKKVYDFIPYLKELENTNDGYNYISSDNSRDSFENKPQMKYGEKLNDFVETLYKEGVIIPNYKEVLNKYFPGKDIRKLTIEEVNSSSQEAICAIISNIIRQDRYVDGLFLSKIKNGNIVYLLELLKSKE